MRSTDGTDAVPYAIAAMAPAPQPSEDSLADLKRQLEVMQQQIEKLATKP